MEKSLIKLEKKLIDYDDGRTRSILLCLIPKSYDERRRPDITYLMDYLHAMDYKVISIPENIDLRVHAGRGSPVCKFPNAVLEGFVRTESDELFVVKKCPVYEKDHLNRIKTI